MTLCQVKWYFCFMCLTVLTPCMYVCHMCTWSPWRPEHCHMVLGIKLGTSGREASALNSQIISSVPKCPYLWVLDFIVTSSHRNIWHESRRKVVCRAEETNRQVGTGAMHSKSKTSVREMAYGTHIKQGNCNVLEVKHRETASWPWPWQWLI